MDDVLKQIDELHSTAMSELNAAADPAGLEQYRIKYLGSNGKLKAAMDWIKTAPPQQKRDVGQKLNGLKKEITEAFETAKGRLAGGASVGKDAADVTEPGMRPAIGARHPIMQVVDE